MKTSGASGAGDGSEKGACLGDRERTFWTDKANQERPMSSEATEGVCFAGL